MKWKKYANSENSWEPVEGLENAGGPVQAWWTYNMPGEKLRTVFSGYIAIYFTPTKNGYEKHSEELVVDLGFLGPHLDTDDDSEEIYLSCSMFEMMFSFCIRGVTGTGYYIWF